MDLFLSSRCLRRSLLHYSIVLLLAFFGTACSSTHNRDPLDLALEKAPAYRPVGVAYFGKPLEGAEFPPYGSSHYSKNSGSLSKDEGDFYAENRKRVADLISGRAKPPTPDEYKQELSDLAHGWFFGPGFGTAILNIGTVIAVPPYALYLVGNAALSVTGVGPVYPTDLMPAKAADVVGGAFHQVVSIPGRVNAVIFDEPFNE